MLSTENAQFKVNRDGTLSLYPGPGFTLPEVVEVIKLAIDHARSSKIRIPTQWNKWWLL